MRLDKCEMKDKFVKIPRRHTLILPKLCFGFACPSGVPPLEVIRGVDPCIPSLISSYSEMGCDLRSLEITNQLEN